MKFLNIMSNKEFIEGKDYYLIKGRVIFSESHLRDRGSCCGNSCEFCPYTEKAKGNKQLKK
jgi:hypothetical protein